MARQPAAIRPTAVMPAGLAEPAAAGQRAHRAARHQTHPLPVEFQVDVRQPAQPAVRPVAVRRAVAGQSGGRGCQPHRSNQPWRAGGPQGPAWRPRGSGGRPAVGACPRQAERRAIRPDRPKGLFGQSSGRVFRKWDGRHEAVNSRLHRRSQHSEKALGSEPGAFLSGDAGAANEPEIGYGVVLKSAIACIIVPLSATSNSGRYGLERLRRDRPAG